MDKKISYYLNLNTKKTNQNKKIVIKNEKKTNLIIKNKKSINSETKMIKIVNHQKKEEGIKRANGPKSSKCENIYINSLNKKILIEKNNFSKTKKNLEIKKKREISLETTGNYNDFNVKINKEGNFLLKSKVLLREKTEFVGKKNENIFFRFQNNNLEVKNCNKNDFFQKKNNNLVKNNQLEEIFQFEKDEKLFKKKSPIKNNNFYNIIKEKKLYQKSKKKFLLIQNTKKRIKISIKNNFSTKEKFFHIPQIDNSEKNNEFSKIKNLNNFLNLSENQNEKKIQNIIIDKFYEYDFEVNEIKGLINKMKIFWKKKTNRFPIVFRKSLIKNDEVLKSQFCEEILDWSFKRI